MASNYIQSDEQLVWTNTTGSAVTSGSIVKIGAVLGVALVDIANGASGTVKLEGTFLLPKVAGAVIAQGETLTWDVSAAAFDDNAATAATGDVTGACAFAFSAAGNGVTTLEVILTGVPGTVH